MKLIGSGLRIGFGELSEHLSSLTFECDSLSFEKESEIRVLLRSCGGSQLALRWFELRWFARYLFQAPCSAKLEKSALIKRPLRCSLSSATLVALVVKYSPSPRTKTDCVQVYYFLFAEPSDLLAEYSSLSLCLTLLTCYAYLRWCTDFQKLDLKQHCPHPRCDRARSR